ncbi:hypothetical protein [Rhodoferax sp. GW822-FHT02A01]|uniref:hypothetical protein n=1 Tax=Rhodoferax sp. GW822-FHT02A01 TaxID=3141537 RepID=UPI00315C8995
MKLTEVKRQTGGGVIRISSTIVSTSGQQMEIWAEVPTTLESSLSTSGNPWLLVMLPIAACIGEDIELDLPVDDLLRENLAGVLATWCQWFTDLKPVRITAPRLTEKPNGNKTASFFSGGVDSYFNIGRRLGLPDMPDVGRTDELLTVWGFDVGVYDLAGIEPLRTMLTSAAADVGLPHYVVRTNLREHNTAWRRRWGPLTHACGLAFISLLLEKRYSSAVWGSTNPYGQLFPWGSHPMVDSLFSTSTTTMVHDGAAFNRVQKTEFVTRLPQGIASLHVCQAEAKHNCSNCEKCFRTMVTIDALGRRDIMGAAFDWSEYSLDKVSRILAMTKGVRSEYLEILAAARELGRDDVAAAVSASLRLSAALRPVFWVTQALINVPVVWRLANAVEIAIRTRVVAPKFIKHSTFVRS